MRNNFTLTNSSLKSLDFSKIKIRYYFTADEGIENAIFNCYDAGIYTKSNEYKNISKYVHSTFVKIPEPLENADSYLEISFDKEAGTFNADDVLKLQTAINNKEWQNFNSEDDYSFNDASKTEVLVDGQVVQGTAPSKKAAEEEMKKPALSLDLKNNPDESSNALKPEFILNNTGNCDIDLKDVSFKYFFTALSDAETIFTCSYADTTDCNHKDFTSFVTGKVEKIDALNKQVNRFVTISFTDGVLKKGQSLKIQSDIHNADWADFDKEASSTYNTQQSLNPSLKSSVPEKEEPQFNEITDELRNITPDEVNASILTGIPDKIEKTTPLTIGFKNTSNVDMDLSKAELEYFYKKSAPSGTDEFKIAKATIVNSNNELTNSVYSRCTLFHFDKDSNDSKYCLDLTFYEDAGILKPGETLLINGYFTNDRDNYNQSTLQNPVLFYDDESINGDVPEEYVKDSRIFKRPIIIDHYAETKDTPVEISLATNTLKSIDLYTTRGKFLRTLEEGTDYILTKRSTVILKESFLCHRDDAYVSLDFKFSAGRDAVLDVQPRNMGLAPDHGGLTIQTGGSISYYSPNDPDGDGSIWTKLTVPVTISDKTNEEICDSTLVLKYDKYSIKSLTIENLNEDKLTVEVDNNLGIIKINLHEGTITNSESGPDFNIIIQPDNNAKQGNIKLKSLNENRYKTKKGSTLAPCVISKSNTLLPAKEKLYFYTQSSDAYHGVSIKIPVFVSNTKYYNLASFDFTIKYDKNVFDFPRVTLGDIYDSNKELFSYSVNRDDSTISVSYNTKDYENMDNRIYKEGALFYITLTVKTNAPIGNTLIKTIKGSYKDFSYDGKYINDTHSNEDISFASINVSK